MLISEMKIPEYIVLSDFEEVSQKKLSKKLDEIIGKDRWDRSVDTDTIHSYRAKQNDGGAIIGLMIFQDNAPKEECVKCFVKKDLK